MRMRRPLLPLLTTLIVPSLLWAGTITGHVTYTGTPPKMYKIDMSDDPSCIQPGAAPVTAENVVTGPNHGLKNVVVYVSAGAPDENQIPEQAVTIEQKGCRYVPHVVVIHTGQEVRILNRDQTLHNVHPTPKANRQWNKSQPPGAPAISEKFDQAEFFPVRCNVHPWMRGYIAVLKTSHYDVSQDDGSFKLPNLPPGKYTITAWHEEYGTQTADVTITGEETQTVTFNFKVKSSP